jgi:hypothetical protein
VTFATRDRRHLPSLEQAHKAVDQYTARFFFILAPLWPLDIIDTLLKGKQHFIDQGPLYVPSMAIWTIGTVIAGITASEHYHRFWSIFFPLYVIAYTTIVLLKLE